MKNLLLVSMLFIGSVNALELNNNQTVSFSLNGNSLSSNVFIQVPANANTLKVEIENGVSSSDFDLFMRFGSDFTATSFNDILAQADYSSAGANAEELFTISTALNTPLRAGTWYIAVFNFNAITENINLTASFSDAPLSTPVIEFIFNQETIIGTNDPCDIAGWNDTTAFTPISGNNATTLGQARKNAVLKATELMTENLQSTTPLIIQGCWPDDLETSTTSATLANAGARTFVQNGTGLIENTWYPVAIAERQAGTQACKFIGGDCGAHAILINFNPKIDTDAGLGSARWYYGLNAPPANNNPDFISTALHEMTHGLGFTSAIFISDEDETITCPVNQQIPHTIGTMLCNQIDIFSSFLVQHNQDDSTTALSAMATDAQRADAMTSAGRLLWNSEFTNTSELNTLSNTRLGFVQLYAPSVISPGSSVSHLSRAYRELMEPFQDANIRTMGLTTPMLWDMGWDPRPKNASPIKNGMYYDKNHNGNGFVIEPISTANGIVYFTIFYTYKDDGTSEWYTSVSSLENNVLNINNMQSEGSLDRFIYDFNINPQGTASPISVDTSIGATSLQIDFNDTVVANSAACNDGIARGDHQALASWAIGNQSGQWCIEPFSNLTGKPPSDDFGAQWWAGSDDDGWGLSLVFANENNTTIIATIYYYDATGKPRWVQGVQSGFVVGTEITLDMQEVVGYPRNATPTELIFTSTGSLTLTINSKTGNGSDGILDVDITYQGAEGGNWSRSGIPITLLSDPH